MVAIEVKSIVGEHVSPYSGEPLRVSSNPVKGWSAAEVVVVRFKLDTVVGMSYGTWVKRGGIASCMNSISGITSA